MTTAKNYGIDIENIRSKIYHYKKQKIAYFVTVTFITGKQKEVIIERGTSKMLSQIEEMLKCEKPDKIQIEYFKGDSEKRNDVRLYPFEDVSEQTKAPLQPQFQGLGEVEISRIVDDRFQERQRKEEYEQLKEQVLELSTANEEFQETIDQLETENERLEKILDEKSQVRYYAGMLGDILEGIGISKDKIRNPIASLMGISDSEKSNEISQASQQSQVHNDTSGIVENDEPISKEQRERSEIITLITQYLESTDNKMLALIFTLFSEIEHDIDKANAVITYLKSQNK